jgi:hypothetical protein
MIKRIGSRSPIVNRATMNQVPALFALPEALRRALEHTLREAGQ